MEQFARQPRQMRQAQQKPVFVEGPLLKHILVMTGTGAVGLMAIFLGDLANIFFLGRLGDESVVAAVGYASSIQFLTIAIGIGLAIATTSLVSPALGAGQRSRARRLSVNAHVWTFIVSSILAAVVWLTIDPLLAMLGATGRTHALGASYLTITVPALPFLSLGMTSAAVLRSLGDPRRAMYVTLSGAIVNTALDPIFIFGFSLGIEGAAIASTLSRFVVVGVGFYGVVVVHQLVARFRLAPFMADALPLASVAVPAVMTNVATPFANAFVTRTMADFGDSAVAGWAILGRILPVAFGAIFALSGSIGPIVGQNYGAGQYARMQQAYTLSLRVTTGFTVIAWAALALLSQMLAELFLATGDAERLILLFCHWLAPLFAFLGALFVSNAVFNTLRRAHISTMLNWGRATMGTIPFVMLGAKYGGADGVLVGNMVGGILFGSLGVVLCYRLMDRLAAK